MRSRGISPTPSSLDLFCTNDITPFDILKLGDRHLGLAVWGNAAANGGDVFSFGVIPSESGNATNHGRMNPTLSGDPDT